MAEREMTMVERVGVAIRYALAKHNEREGFSVDPDANGYVDIREVDDIAVARAAIEAIRQPDMTMIEEGARAKSLGCNPYSIFTSMIDAALSETPAKEP